MPAEFSYALSVGCVMLHPTTNAPILETGKEGKHVLAASAVPKDPVAAEEMFLALVHDGARRLWEREVKSLWCPTEKKNPTSSPPPSKG